MLRARVETSRAPTVAAHANSLSPGIHDVAEASWQPVAGSACSIEENWLFRLRRERFRSRASGREHDYYVLALADSVNVVALTTERQLVLVRQFRAGANLDSLETPGGLLEPGEDPCVAAARELLEETGYAGDAPVSLGWLWTNPSLLTSRNAMVLIPGVRNVAEPKPDASEELAIELVPAASVAAMIRDGRIGHALTALTLLWWMHESGEGSRAMSGAR
jgi:8-oxo-dGTP pyrophosphatase MutT (NUDIX family)